MTSEMNKRKLYGIIIYTVITAFIAAAGLIFLLVEIPESGSGSPDVYKQTFWMTVLAMIAAGIIGGCLYNFRGIILHTADKDYNDSYTITYVLRPVLGAVSGLTVFFILMGGVMTFNLGTDTGQEGWLTFMGRMPYIAMAVLAGYASQEFMMKLKDVARTLFKVSDENQ